MATSPTSHKICLIRGINVGGRNIVPMTDLRAITAALKWKDATTYIQSGNLVFTASAAHDKLEKQLEDALEKKFGFRPDVVIRDAAAWEQYIKRNPLRREAENAPNAVTLTLSKRPPIAGSVAALQERATMNERIAMQDDALWIHFPDGMGRTKLTPAVFDRAVGSPVTSRNWNTVLKLGEMAGIV
jgi:uncharacterized protein (DUF1697 family)